MTRYSIFKRFDKSTEVFVSDGKGMVYLVGAGPGAPGLITLRGAECLGRADVVLYDYLVNPLILRHAKPSAEQVCLGRHGVGRILTQEEINARLVELAQSGKTVVRLKGGDPAVFARGVEETETLAAAKIPFEIVPGITAALAAGSYAGIPVTHRELASGVALVTGQEQAGKEMPQMDYGSLAAFAGTIVIYMGVTTAPIWTRKLLEAGKPSDTPVAIVRRCSLSDQTVDECTLGSVVNVLHSKKIRPPAIVILGPVSKLHSTLDWFSRRPLFGTTVLVTRSLEQSGELIDRLGELGARVMLQRAIKIRPPENWRPVDDAIDRLSEYDWLVFSSANGVRYFFDRLLERGGDLRQLGHLKLAAIGPATRDCLAKYHLNADIVPSEYRAEALAESLAKVAAGKRFLLARASRGREVLADSLPAAGAAVDQVIVYQSEDIQTPDAEIAEALREGQITWTMATSSAIARSLVHLFGDDLRQTRLATISPLTSSALEEMGHSAAVEAEEFTTAGVVEAILRSK